MTSKITEWICIFCGQKMKIRPNADQCINCGDRTGVCANKWIYDDLPKEHPQFWNRKEN